MIACQPDHTLQSLAALQSMRVIGRPGQVELLDTAGHLTEMTPIVRLRQDDCKHVMVTCQTDGQIPLNIPLATSMSQP